MAETFHDYFLILLTSALFRDAITNFNSRFWRLYLRNRLFSQNSLPLVWKIFSCFFKISKKFWRLYHLFSAEASRKFSSVIIQILTEKHFSRNFWTTDTLNMVDPSYWYILITHWWPIHIPKAPNGFELGWMMPQEVLFSEIDEKQLASANISHKRWSNA